jgi:Asp-tRNA(Asn)/Glu-tRNA(Gln) amidotransferase A subunit family amidase
VPDLSRSEFLKLTGVGIAGMVLPGSSLAGGAQESATVEVTEVQIKTALKLANLNFADDEVKEMVGSVKGFGENWPALREQTKDAGFMGMNWRVVPETIGSSGAPVRSLNMRSLEVERPKSDEDLAFMSVVELGYLLRNKQVTSVELTKLYIARLKKYGPKLRCVVNLTEERALKQAAIADENLRTSQYNGPLCGIPFGVKDLFDAKGYPTTWGIRTRKDHISEEDSDVVSLLEKAGAVLVAKLSLGALAMGDVWYEGRTESPWDPKVGSSGSSAGSGSAVAGGLVPFAIGTETNGSLVSPGHNCRVTALRPTFGSVSRAGAMALCWSLDKVGPLCRSAEDCSVVFSVISGNTGNDPSQINRPFDYKVDVDMNKLRWGYMVFKEGDVDSRLDDANRPWLKTLRAQGIEPKPFFMPEYPDGIDSILLAECAAAFESFTRSEDIQDLEGYSSWPETFRSARLIPAVEYIQADRYRVLLAKKYGEVLSNFDVVLADDRLYPRIFGLNATGIPQLLVPAGVDDRGRARSFSMVSPILQEATMLSAAYQLQEKLGFHRLRPDMSIWE